MKITREQLRNIVGEVLQEEKDYQSFFNAMLKKHGVSSPADFKSDEEKKAFFNKVDSTWKGVSEKLSHLKEDELTAKQQKIDLNKNGKVDGDDLSKLRAGAQTEGEGEESTSLTKILSKEGEILVKSGAGKMYNITKVNELKDGETVVLKRPVNYKLGVIPAGKSVKVVMISGIPHIEHPKNPALLVQVRDLAKSIDEELVNESKEADILAKIEKLRLDAEAGKIKTLDQFLDKFKPLQKQLKALGEELVGGQKKLDVDKDGEIEASDLAKLRASKNELTFKTGAAAQAYKAKHKIRPNTKISIKGIPMPNGQKKVNEGKYDADLDKIEAAVKGATSFMNVGSELKKAGIKYDFTTSMIPMYMIKVSGNTIAIVNKKYAAGAEKTVGDIAIGLLN